MFHYQLQYNYEKSKSKLAMVCFSNNCVLCSAVYKTKITTAIHAPRNAAQPRNIKSPRYFIFYIFTCNIFWISYIFLLIFSFSLLFSLIMRPCSALSAALRLAHRAFPAFERCSWSVSSFAILFLSTKNSALFKFFV